MKFIGQIINKNIPENIKTSPVTGFKRESYPPRLEVTRKNVLDITKNIFC